jgi:hypothetical protein
MLLKASEAPQTASVCVGQYDIRQSKPSFANLHAQPRSLARHSSILEEMEQEQASYLLSVVSQASSHMMEGSDARLRVAGCAREGGRRCDGAGLVAVLVLDASRGKPTC